MLHMSTFNPSIHTKAIIPAFIFPLKNDTLIWKDKYFYYQNINPSVLEEYLLPEDNNEDIEWLSNKIVNLRIFDDEFSVPNIALKEISGDVLLVSQFTLHASTKKGNRPSYIKASKPFVAVPLYEMFIKKIESALYYL